MERRRLACTERRKARKAQMYYSRFALTAGEPPALLFNL